VTSARADSETVLPGGRFAQPVRRGNEVHRTAGRGASNVHALLDHFATRSCPLTPRVRGSSADGTREVLSWLPGTAAVPPMTAPVRSEQALAGVARAASHAFGDLPTTLAALRRHLRPGGQVLLGDTFWQAPPAPQALSALDAAADDFPNLTGFVHQVHEASFEPGFGHVSTLAEWDDYEWSWTGSLVDWALNDAATDADREHALAAARKHRQQWLGGYRSVLGFATVVLHDLAAQQDAD